MQNPKLLLASLILSSLAVFATGCSIPGVYKIDIQQGNVVTQDMIDQLRPGMTPRQVRFIMGSPLIMDTFHPNRWDYLYSFQAGGSRRRQERISLMFDNANQQLVGLTGDFMPGVSRDQEILGTGQSTTIVTPGEGEEPETAPEPGSLLEQLQKEIDEVEPAPVPVPEAL
ncbi:outer membrane protein assembly factor BamE [Azomonas macrocytogenes]|uniref:Outer membrane protein assembly factor BamE n=1 Tax=Azomonas macrocytogenes TaxID=69962 RepID=A0A839T3E8_AZOMA|nr:outer membrane protein assembly factor BamE [Azomonas macrocytogenes]MBB3104057.1 outer membrane protein assembly factor BamE [Azomonas macrocytogenes]